MKRTMIFCLSLVLGLATMMAQDTKQCPKGEGQQCAKLTTEQKAQLITDRMAKAYDLTAEQKAKLLELNTKALTPRHHKAAPCPKDGDHKCDKAKQDCNKPCPEGGEKKCDKPATCPMDGAKKCAPGPDGYFKALAEIMTPEQFAAYRADKMIERQLMPRRPQMRGRFGHRGMMAPGFNGAHHKCAQGGGHEGCAKAGSKDCKHDMKGCKDAGKECKHDMKGCEKGGKDCKPCQCAGKCGKDSCKKCQACKK